MELTQQQREEWASLVEDVKDYAKQVRDDEQEVRNANESLWKSKVRHAEAIIALDAFKHEHNIA